MKKIALAVGLSFVATADAQAQSSVTLYGIITGGIAYANNTHGKATIGQFDSGTQGISASRWGFKGVEDLGGGLQAVFDLENGFSVNNGAANQGGDLWGRQAWVGLNSARYGTLTFGRQGDMGVTFVSPLTFEWFGGNFATHPADYDNINWTHRINNSVKYVSANYGGFQFGGLYSFGGVPGSVTQNQFWSIGAAWSGGPFAIGASLFNARDPNVSLYGSNPGTTATADNAGSPTSNQSIAGFATAGSQQTAAVAATYALGDALFGVSYSNTQFRDLGSNPLTGIVNHHGSTNLSTVSGSLRYQVTPLWRVGAAVDYTYGGNVNQAGGAKYTQINLATGYSLSKRTDLYATAVFQHASGTNSLGTPAVAQIGYLAPSSTGRQVALSTGIIHKF